MLSVLTLAALAAAGADLPQAEQPGRVTGQVVSAATGEPIPGAYVGIGEFGDAGGSNLDRFRRQGIHAAGKSGRDGRFVLDGLAPGDRHPLVVTHPDFVRHDATVAIRPDAPEVEVDVRLRPGAVILGQVVDAAGEPLRTKFILRLESLDGRRFIPPGRDPHLGAFASSAWVERVEEGAFIFRALEPGSYAVEAMRLSPREAAYFGAVPRIEARAGEPRAALIAPASHDTTLTVEVPEDALKISGTAPVLAFTRKPGLLLWDDGKARSLEDARLGRVVLTSLLQDRIRPGEDYRIRNFPPGAYSVFLAPGGRGARVDLAAGKETRVEIPRFRPQAPGTVDLGRLWTRLKPEARSYTAAELCERLSQAVGSRPRIEADERIARERIDPPAREAAVWDFLEGLFLEKGWTVEERGETILVVIPGP